MRESLKDIWINQQIEEDSYTYHIKKNISGIDGRKAAKL